MHCRKRYVVPAVLLIGALAGCGGQTTTWAMPSRQSAEHPSPSRSSHQRWATAACSTSSAAVLRSDTTPATDCSEQHNAITYAAADRHGRAPVRRRDREDLRGRFRRSPGPDPATGQPHDLRLELVPAVAPRLRPGSPVLPMRHRRDQHLRPANPFRFPQAICRCCRAKRSPTPTRCAARARGRTCPARRRTPGGRPAPSRAPARSIRPMRRSRSGPRTSAPTW